METESDFLLPDWPFPERPSRILKRPLAVDIIGSRIVYHENSWRITNWEGPEILSGVLWDDPCDRMYFKVGTHREKDLWLYRRAGDQTIYLHGFFD